MDFVRHLWQHGGSSHARFCATYLGSSLFQRHITELNHRTHLAWYKAQLHRRVLTNKNVSIKHKHETMTRMKWPVLQEVFKQYPVVEMWTTRLARRRYHFASQFWNPTAGQSTSAPSIRQSVGQRTSLLFEVLYVSPIFRMHVAACTAWKHKAKEFVRNFNVL